MALQCPCCNFDVANGIKCHGCKSWYHFYCTFLPIYHMILLKHSHFSFLCESCVKAKCETVFLDEHKLLKDDVEAVSKMREESAVAGNNITDECNSTDGEVSKSDDGVDLRPGDNEDSKHDDDEESNFDEGEDPKSDDDEDSRPNDDQNQSLVVDSSIVSDTVRLDVPSPILTDRTKLVSRDVTQQTDLDHLNSDEGKDITVCKFHLQGRCIHGRYGKNCSNAHVPLCKLFIRSGELGCSKGIDCAYAHPKLCTRSLRHNECKRKKCFLYHVTGSSRPMFAQNKQIDKPNNEPVAPNPGDKVNKPNPQTLPKPLPHQVPTSKANASKTKPPVKPPVNPNIDLATMNSFLEKLTALQSQMENVVAQQKYFSQVVMPPRWTSPQDPSIPHWTPHPAMSLYRPMPPQFAPLYQY